MCRVLAVGWIAQRDSTLARNGRGGSGPREILAQSHFRDQAVEVSVVIRRASALNVIAQTG